MLFKRYRIGEVLRVEIAIGKHSLDKKQKLAVWNDKFNIARLSIKSIPDI